MIKTPLHCIKITSIVSTSVDLAITAVVTTTSFAFPPAVPDRGWCYNNASEGTFLSGFYAANAAAKINSETPLLGFEKKNEFIRRFLIFFGAEETYLNSLVDDLDLWQMTLR